MDSYRDGTSDDHAVARRSAERTGEVLLELRAERGFADAAALRTQGDRLAQEALAEYLAAVRPDDPVLSEEAPDDDRRLSADRVWIVDPLDGTREFSEEGRTDWAVHVALWERGALVAGAVALPALGTVLTADRPPVLAPLRRPPRILVSRTRPPAEAVRVATALQAELVPMGSAGAKVAAVLGGEGEAYVHAGGQYQWDSAAPIAVAQAAGLHTSRLDGSALVYNSTERSLPDLLVCRKEIVDELRSALGDEPVPTA